MTLEEQLELQARRGLLGLGFEEETAEEYAPWASLLAQFIPGVGEGVGVDNTINAINDERYGDAAIEGGLTLLGAVPVVGDMAAAAIKGIRRAPVKAFDEAAWLKDNPRPFKDKKISELTPEELKAYNSWKTRKYNEKNKNDPDFIEKRKRHQRETYLRARDSRLDYAKKKYYQDHEKTLEYQRERYKKNPATYIQAARNRELALGDRTPSWRNQEKINEIYRTAAEVSAETGIPHHVDHVIPLKGRNVSGLHHQDNLLIVPGTENLSKGNRFEPGDLPPRAGIRNARALLKRIREAKERGEL